MAGGGDELRRPMSRRDFLRLPQLLRERAAERFSETPPPSPSLPLPHDVHGMVDVGAPDEVLGLPLGAVVTRFAAQGRFYLARVADGVTAVARVCQGPGCAVLWQEKSPATPADAARGWATGRFVCLQHQAAYDRYGEPAGGAEAPGPLDRYAVQVINGRVLVDTAAPLARTALDGRGRPATRLD